MRKLTILYDPFCRLCKSSRLWMLAQAKVYPLEFLASNTDEARRRFPTLTSASKSEELIVIDEKGNYYTSSKAWIMCMLALTNYRGWARRCASPLLFPLAKKAFHYVSMHRSEPSKILRLQSERNIENILTHLPREKCSNDN